MTISPDFVDLPYFSDLGAVQIAAVLDAPLVDSFALAGSTLTWRADGRAHLGAALSDVLAAVPDAGLIVVTYSPFHRPPLRDDLLGDLLAALRRRAPDSVLLLADAYQSGQHHIEAPGGTVLASYPEADAFVKYEAEVTLPGLVRAWLEEGIRPAGCHAGVPPPHLDELPFPAWDRIDLDHLFRFHGRVVERLGRGAWAFPIDGRTLPVVTSRGCPYDCIHCSSNPGRLPGSPKMQRRLSAPRLAEIVSRLARVHGATRLAVLDEMVNASAAHLAALLDAVAAAGVLFDVPNGMRADGIAAGDFSRMKGRVSTVSVSAESGVQRVADEIVGKRLDLSAVVRAAENARAAGVPLLVHYIIGLPGETAAEVNGTLAFAADLFDRFGAEPAIQFAAPLPGTGLARNRSGTPPPDGDWGPAFQKVPSQPGAIPPEALLRFKAAFEERMRASRGPKKLILNVTYVCNNHCRFCAVGNRSRAHGDPVRQREQLERYRRLGVTMVDFDGGEPTMNPGLVPLVRRARALGYESVNVTTNGRLCSYETFARTLVRSGLTTLLFSVHGPDAASHAEHVCVPEAFEQTTAGIRNCVRHCPPGVELGMNVTVTAMNQERLSGLARLAWDLGLRWLNFQFLTPFGRATSAVAPDTAVAAERTARVIDRWQGRMKIAVVNLPFCFLPGYEPFLSGDLGKLERHMVFVNDEEVNLASYLGARRVRKPECAPCPHAILCGGFYEMGEAEEPPWRGMTLDLERPPA